MHNEAAEGHPQRWRLLTVAMLGYAMVQMGLVPVNAIMPALATTFSVSLGTASWLLAGYLLALSALILPAGRLGDRLGHRPVFLWGLAGYTLTAALAGVSNTYWMLLMARLGQGLTSALILGSTMAMVTSAFPLRVRGRVLSFVTLSSYIGGAASTYLATWAIQHATWHWTFWMLVPIGLLGLVLGVGIRDPRPVTAPARSRIDWIGAAILAAMLVAFSLGLNHLHDGGETFADGWRWHLPMHVLAAALLLLFVWVEQRVAEPIIPLHYLKNRMFLAALSAHFILHTTMMGSTGTLPFMIQIGMGLTPTHTANVLVFLNILSLVSAPVSGWLYDRANSKLLLPGAMFIIASGMFLFGLLGVNLSFMGLLGLGLYMGTGMGLFLSANNAALMSSVPAEIRGFASGMLETTRQVGHGIATTLVGTMLGAGVALAGKGAGGRDMLVSAFATQFYLMAGLCALGLLCSIWYGVEKDRAVRSGGSASVAAGD